MLSSCGDREAIVMQGRVENIGTNLLETNTSMATKGQDPDADAPYVDTILNESARHN